MSYLQNYVIPFSGLKPGAHQYDFEVDDRFFESFEDQEISQGDIHVDLMLEKQERMLVLEFDIKGKVNIMCDRCLDLYDQPVSGKERLIVKFGEDYHEESEEVIVIPESEHQLDVSHYIYEFIHLLMPLKRVHPNDEEGISSCNLDITGRMEAHENDKSTDPRWDALKNLQTQMKNNHE